MTQKRPTYSRAKPRFSRRFLWILIILLALTIPLLSRLGPDQVAELPAREQVASVVPRSALTPIIELRGEIPAYRLSLPQAPLFHLSVLGPEQPQQLAPLPEPLNGTSFHGYGLWGLRLEVPYSAEALTQLREYLSDNLPPTAAGTSYIFSGPWQEQQIAEMAGAMVLADAPAAPAAPAPRSAVQAYALPPPGAPDYWASVLAMDLLEQALVDTTTRLTRDDRVRPPRLYLSASLLPQQRQVPGVDEFQEARKRLHRTEAVEHLSPAAVHEELVRMAAWGLPKDWWQNAPAQIDALTYQDFTDYWRRWLGPNATP